MGGAGGRRRCQPGRDEIRELTRSAACPADTDRGVPKALRQIERKPGFLLNLTDSHDHYRLPPAFSALQLPSMRVSQHAIHVDLAIACFSLAPEGSRGNSLRKAPTWISVEIAT
jgi:hypothetical protein